jgi:TolB-like protein
MTTRRLAAILAADVVGYSRLMEQDEAGTLAALKARRKEILQPLVAEHQGRIVKVMGDGVLVEFASAVNAVACAVELQKRMAAANDGAPEERRVLLRVGINLGDVIVEGGDLYGDGVNVAARLQEMSEPGGICITGKVHDEVRGKLDLAFDDLGAREVKNIAAPVRIYSARLEPSVSVSAPLSLPAKPSIAVLPFVNMSGDVEQEYFSDGITEDLITALSKIRWFFVIARNSTFAYKSRSVAPRELGRDLGVRYVLEGSVRKGGNRVRISAQLVDAASGHHVWAERYDRDLEDIFALQDEMIETIVRAIEPELGRAERERARRKPPGSLDAWELFQRGLWYHYRFTRDDIAEAERCFHRAIEVDPTFALPFAALAHACYWDALFGYATDVKKTLAKGLDLARKAVSLDDREAFAHFSLGRIQTLRAELDGAIAELEQAIELNPNFAHAYYGLGIALVWAGQPAQGMNRIDTALRLNPRDPSVWTFQAGRALALFLLDRLDEAADWAQRSTQSVPTGLWAHGVEAAVLAHLGRDREAAAALAQVYRLKPNFSAEFVREVFPFRVAAHRDRFLDALRRAGLPE